MKFKKYFSIIGIIIFIYILLKLDFREILAEIANAKAEFLLLAGVFVFLLFIAQTLKWFAIARVQKTQIGFWNAFRINLISGFYGFITPSRVGAAMRADYLKKYKGGSLGKGLSNYTLDKVLDLCSLVFLVVVFSFVFKDVLNVDLIYYAIGIFILLVGSLFIFLDKNRSRKILRKFYIHFVPLKLKEKLRKGFYSFYEDMPNKKYFGLFFVLNITNWITIYVLDYFIGLSLGIDVPFFYFLAIFPIATLVSQIPITVGGLGTREATLISLFGLFGVEATKIFSLSIIGLAIGSIIPAMIGALLVLEKDKK